MVVVLQVVGGCNGVCRIYLSVGMDGWCAGGSVHPSREHLM